MDPTIQQEQAKLKALGLYNGPVDGRDGPETAAARARFMAQQQAEQQSARSSQLQGQQAEAQRITAEAQRAETDRLRVAAETQAKDKAAANAPLEQARQIAMNAVPGALGYVGGHKAANYLDDRFQQAAGYRAEQLKNLAAASDGLDPRAVAKTADRLGLAQTRRGGTSSYLVPATLAATGAGARFFGADHINNEVGADVTRAFGNAEMGAGLGMLGQMMLQDVSSTPKINAVDLAKIEQARLGGKAPPQSLASAMGQSVPPQEPPSAAPQTAVPGSKAYLVEQAKGLGIKGAASMSKADLATALTDSIQGHAQKRTRISKVADGLKGGALLAPVAAGALAYDSMMHPVAASDGTPREPNRAAALATGGAAAGGAYGASKLAGMLGRAAPTAARLLGGGLSMAAPVTMIDAMTDYSPGQLEQGRRTLSGALPDWMQSEAIRSAGDRGASEDRGRLQEAMQALPPNEWPARAARIPWMSPR